MAPERVFRLTNHRTIFAKEFAQTLLTACFLVVDPVIGATGRLIRRHNLVRRTQGGCDPNSGSRHAAVYVHFDPKGTVHDYVVYQLGELVAAGFRVTFVSNAPTFSETSCGIVAPFCRSVIWRFNTGYDFGAYKDGIDALEDIDQIDQLLLMNDSVYGPFWNLSQMLRTIDSSKIDFWGIVDSWEQRYHLQTFFVLFFSKALKSAGFRDFWRRLPYINNKSWIVRNGEIGLSQALARCQLRGAALAPYWDAAEKMKDRLTAITLETGNRSALSFHQRLRGTLLGGRPMNAMHYFWDLLILDYRCPFIKRELIKSNPARIPSQAHWRDVITSASDYDVTMIERHLRF